MMKADKILVIRSGAIGDIIMATPFLKNLRETFPDSRISFFVGEWSKKVLLDNPNVNDVIGFKDDVIIKKDLSGVISLIKGIRRKRFEMCFILDKSWMWNLFALFCGIRQRIGFARGNEGMFNTKSVRFEGSKKETEYYLDLLREIGVRCKEYSTQIYTNKHDKAFADKFIKQVSKVDKIIGICPGGAINPGQSAMIKRWPIEKYIELTEKRKHGFVIFGDEKDREVARKIIKRSGNKKIYDATGLSIQETKEIMERCNSIVSHDSGALHIASTTSTKIIALFGPTPAKRFAPKNSIVVESKYKPGYTIYGKFKGKDDSKAMGSIEVNRVVELIDKLK